MTGFVVTLSETEAGVEAAIGMSGVCAGVGTVSVDEGDVVGVGVWSSLALYAGFSRSTVTVSIFSRTLMSNVFDPRRTTLYGPAYGA